MNVKKKKSVIKEMGRCLSSIEPKKSRFWSLAKKVIYVVLALGVLSIPKIVSSCSTTGSVPSESDLKRFEYSKQFVEHKGIFDLKSMRPWGYMFLGIHITPFEANRFIKNFSAYIETK